MMWKEDALLLVYVALGGALGSVARYLVAGALKGVWSNHFPWEMVFVNTFGCILVGFFAAFLYTKLPHPRWAMLTGFLYLLLQNTLGLLAASVAFWAGKTLL